MSFQGSSLYPSFDPVNRINSDGYQGAVYPGGIEGDSSAGYIQGSYMTDLSNSNRVVPERPQDAFDLNNSSQFPVGWVTLVFILLIILAIVLFFFVRQRQQLIEPDRCPEIRGNYGVTPGFTGKPLQSCGNSGNEPCISVEETLEDAINSCNLRADICLRFSYDPGSGETVILNSTEPLEAANRIDVYTRQVKINNSS